MTATIFEKLTRRLFITTAVTFGVLAGWTLKEDMLHRIQRLEKKRLEERRRAQKESSLTEFPVELQLDEGEASTSNVGFRLPICCSAL